MNRKKIILLIIVISIFLISMACSKNKLNIEELYSKDTSKNITMNIEVNEDNKFTLNIKNESDYDYTFSYYYTIYKYKNSEWVEIEDLPPFEDLGFELKAGESLDQTYFFSETLFSENGKGIYRMRKKFDRVIDSEIPQTSDGKDKENSEYADVVFEIK
ncbi:immunoglobulin-like domain-containing protein [Helcococcus sueciensis]|uniref:immunoglobulin-like domain-containing protein n=1 Tax=Helcococcus sueciensis TaxID=241555 RepID=UPI00040D402F|nr:immunoglobulin-like domain-containing protein [Helcococcus sueciensis]